MKAMPALSATDVAPCTGQGGRKVADEESGKGGTDFTQVLRKRENPEKRSPATVKEMVAGNTAASVAKETGGKGEPLVTDPELSAWIIGTDGAPGLGNPRHGKRTKRQDIAFSDSLTCMEMPKGGNAQVNLASMPQQVASATVARDMTDTERKGASTMGGRLPLSGNILPENGDATDTTGEMPDPSLPEEVRTGHADAGSRKGRLQEGRKVRIEPAGSEERMPVKVVSVSAERHLEPVGTRAPGGRNGMWQGAAAQALRALDEGLVPQALAGLDGGRGGGPKVIRNLEIQLHPASLGTVTARLTITGGNLEITISVPDRRLADQMARGLDQLVRRIRARDHGSGQTVIHLVTEPQNQIIDRFQQQLPGQPAADGRASFGAQTREGAPGGGHGGRDGHGGAQTHDGGGAGHDGTRNPEGIRRADRRDGLLYL